MKNFFSFLKYLSVALILIFAGLVFFSGGAIMPYLSGDPILKSGSGTESDILSIADSDMTGNTDDAPINRSVDYQVVRSSNGLVANLKVNYYRSGLLKMDAYAHRTYIRVYVPKGSRFIFARGLDGEIESGSEAGRDYFGAYFDSETDKIINLEFHYVLPESLRQSDKYSLFVQKQPGSGIDELTVDLSPRNGVKSYSPTSFFAERNSKGGVRWETDLFEDKTFILDY